MESNQSDSTGTRRRREWMRTGACVTVTDGQDRTGSAGLDRKAAYRNGRAGIGRNGKHRKRRETTAREWTGLVRQDRLGLFCTRQERDRNASAGMNRTLQGRIGFERRPVERKGRGAAGGDGSSCDRIEPERIGRKGRVGTRC